MNHIQQNERASAMNTYRIVTIRDPRTPGFRWYEIVGHNITTGERWTAAVCDTREEARDTLRDINGGAR